MALQPAAGARDLIPQQVKKNQEITKRLAEVYKLWGYEEVSPPRIERLDTLTAGGGIANEDIVRLVADEPLGLRPELTASIARSACTRLKTRERPLRLWASGTTFESRVAAGGGIYIEENLQSGVELFGVKNISAELELLSLLLESLFKLEIDSSHKTKLLLGNTCLMDLVLENYEGKIRNKIKHNLIDYNKIGLEDLEIDIEKVNGLISILEMRGPASEIINKLKEKYGEEEPIRDLARLFKQLEPIAEEKGVILQLDPTFQPHFELYNGLVFQLVCEGKSSPVVIARGGRYDKLVASCGAKSSEAAGAGFSFSIDAIREQITTINKDILVDNNRTLITYGPQSSLEDAMVNQRELHKNGITAVLELDCCNTLEEARSLLPARNCQHIKWLNN